ncbi:very long chain fatty acid elongase F-like isoform X2 [Eurosta solidaginis]
MALSIIAYLSFVLHYGPKWMEQRKPFNLKYVMRVYNAIQVIANFIIFVCGIQNSYMRKEFSFTCQKVDHTNTEPWMWNLIYLSYGYYLTKYLDLLDTVFFVLRKKNNQISFLHVYHHAGMVFGVYCFMTFLAGSHCTMLGIINLFIHTVMYAYYFVTSVWPTKGSVWWKRHITQLQLFQFGYLMLHFAMSIVNNHCQHPVIVSFVGLIQNLFMFALFFDFYYRAYMRKPKVESSEKLENQQKLQIQTQIIQSGKVQAQLSSDDQIEKVQQQKRASKAAEQLNSRFHMTSSPNTATTTTNTTSSTNNIYTLQTSNLLEAKCS